MKRIALFFLIIVTVNMLVGQVMYQGSMSKMGKNGFSPTIAIDTLLQDKDGLIGIGPFGYMQGELTVVDGKPLVGKSAEDGSMAVSVEPTAKAPFFVYSYVTRWNADKVSVEVSKPQDIQALIESYAKEKKINLDNPFPFRIKGIIDTMEVHVVMPRSSDVPGYIEGKKSEKYQYQKVAGEIIGFYSRSGEGIYTHKDSFIHIHFISADQKIVGHIDQIQISPKKMRIYLPTDL